MNSLSSKNRKKPYKIGDLVIEKAVTGSKRRIGEIVFIRGGSRQRMDLLQLSRHDLSPLSRNDLRGPRFFSLKEDQCKRLNLRRYQKKRTFELGDCIRHTQDGRIRFGRIIGFLHPDGLYTESYEKGYNGKDFLECVEISGKAGLPRKVNSEGHPKLLRFTLKKSNYAKFCRWTIKVAYESRIIGNSERELDFLAKILSKKVRAKT